MILEPFLRQPLIVKVSGVFFAVLGALPKGFMPFMVYRGLDLLTAVELHQLTEHFINVFAGDQHVGKFVAVLFPPADRHEEGIRSGIPLAAAHHRILMKDMAEFSEIPSVGVRATPAADFVKDPASDARGEKNVAIREGDDVAVIWILVKHAIKEVLQERNGPWVAFDARIRVGLVNGKIEPSTVSMLEVPRLNSKRVPATGVLVHGVGKIRPNMKDARGFYP